jgi:hypothetical protein
VEDLEREEEIAFGTFEVGKDKLVINTILPDPEKLDKDFFAIVQSRFGTQENTGRGNRIAGCPVL